MAKNKTRKLAEQSFQSILASYGTIASGATLPHPNVFPQEFSDSGINKRDAGRNDYYGMVVTRPPNTLNKLVFGFSYLDNKDNETDEDLYVLDTGKKEVKYFPKGTYEKTNSLYRGTHKGIKDYLISKK